MLRLPDVTVNNVEPFIYFTYFAGSNHVFIRKMHMNVSLDMDLKCMTDIFTIPLGSNIRVEALKENFLWDPL